MARRRSARSGSVEQGRRGSAGYVVVWRGSAGKGRPRMARYGVARQAGRGAARYGGFR